MGIRIQVSPGASSRNAGSRMLLLDQWESAGKTRFTYSCTPVRLVRHAPYCRFLRTWLMLRHLPGPKEASLLKGSLATILHPHNHRIFTALTDTYGPVFRIRAVWKQVRKALAGLRGAPVVPAIGCHCLCRCLRKLTCSCSKHSEALLHVRDYQA